MQTGAGDEEDELDTLEANGPHKSVKGLDANRVEVQPISQGQLDPVAEDGQKGVPPVSQKAVGSPRASQRAMRTSTRNLGSTRGLGGMSSRKASSRRSDGLSSIKRDASQKGMVLPFERMNMAFHHIYYSVNLPSVRAVRLPHASMRDCVCLSIWLIPNLQRAPVSNKCDLSSAGAVSLPHACMCAQVCVSICRLFQPAACFSSETSIVTALPGNAEHSHISQTLWLHWSRGT